MQQKKRDAIRLVSVTKTWFSFKSVWFRRKHVQKRARMFHVFLFPGCFIDLVKTAASLFFSLDFSCLPSKSQRILCDGRLQTSSPRNINVWRCIGMTGWLPTYQHMTRKKSNAGEMHKIKYDFGWNLSCLMEWWKMKEEIATIQFVFSAGTTAQLMNRN